MSTKTKNLESLMADFRQAEAATSEAAGAVPPPFIRDEVSEEQFTARHLARTVANQALVRAQDREAKLRAQLADALDVAEANEPDVSACLSLHADVVAMMAKEQDAPARMLAVLVEEREQHIRNVAQIARGIRARRPSRVVSARIDWATQRGPAAEPNMIDLNPITSWLAKYGSTATTAPALNPPGKLAQLEEDEMHLRAKSELFARNRESLAAARAARGNGGGVLVEREDNGAHAERRALADAHRAREAKGAA